MKQNRLAAIALATGIACFNLCGCSSSQEEPNFSAFTQIADLATQECTYHNVATVYKKGTEVLWVFKTGYKQVWFEYDAKVRIGIDASRVSLSGPNENNVVTIKMPKAQVLGHPEVDEDSFSQLYSDAGKATTKEQAEAYAKAQGKMKEEAESNAGLMARAEKRAQTLLEEYVKKAGEAKGVEYKVKFKIIE
ncbi:MAG: DUF4230 domain-containing protein [Coriobacteriia bacterium]|nr:DUF4230 domain-containing protein [Coriobacteriia bacterium]